MTFFKIFLVIFQVKLSLILFARISYSYNLFFPRFLALFTLFYSIILVFFENFCVKRPLS
ncbi:hypothetical protein HMPREF1871_00896 [Gemelliphila asaccharolytica]|uniref:Uncharacterized protein n=1 Tax=Gemelliphila asaccharolytica TaxID=502393 RepID=A0ABR5TLA0_9BACL|nr:hypothetical protein HMPREF1871_00896 [Gemella asaccharolytica]